MLPASTRLSPVRVIAGRRLRWIELNRAGEVLLELSPEMPLPLLARGTPVEHITHAHLLRCHGAKAENLQAPLNFAQAHHLRLGALDRARRTAHLSGTVEDIAAAFPPVDLSKTRVPPALAGVVEAVLDENGSPGAHRRSVARTPPVGGLKKLSRISSGYHFPPVRGLQQTIGLVEFGGGFRRSDIVRFCQRNRVPVPRITVVPIHGRENDPVERAAVHTLLEFLGGARQLSEAEQQSARMQAAQATLEVTMDIEILAALAPGAAIVVYFAHATERGQFGALHRAVFDERNRPSVLSVSWGQPELTVSTDGLQAINRLLLTAAHLGISVCASSGDAGAQKAQADGLPTVNFPASSPYTLACGGTHAEFAKGSPPRILRESVWNGLHTSPGGASGGGVSRVFPQPSWQRGVGVPLSPVGTRGRGVPDVAGVADPRVGGELIAADRPFAAAGTSAVAPLWAALIARCNHHLGRRCGWVNAPLYRLGREGKRGLRPVKHGSNDGYEAADGWNACAGYGTPDGAAILAHLAAVKTDGIA